MDKEPPQAVPGVATRQKSGEDYQRQDEEPKKTTKKPSNPTRKQAKGTGHRINVKTAVVLALVAVAAAFVIFEIVIPANTAPETVSVNRAQLMKAVDVDRLETARVTYEGIVDHEGGFAGWGAYHVAYKSTVTASIDMSKLSIDVDDEGKTVTIGLPEVTISDPVIDTESLDYLPSNPGVDMKDVLEQCKADAKEATQDDAQIKATAISNAKTSIKALTDPLLSAAGYQLKWGDSTVSSSSDGDDSADEATGSSSSTSTQDGSSTGSEGGNDENA